MKTIDILGTAPSIRDYKHNGQNIKIGVNDIAKYHSVDFLLLLDQPGTFTPERLETIINGQYKKVFTTLDDWKRYFPNNFSKITVAEKGGGVATLDDQNQLPVHVDSTFTAVALAYHMQCKRIVLHGVDFYGHHLMKYSKEILSTYQAMYLKLLSKGVELFVYYNSSLLARTLPFIMHNFSELPIRPAPVFTKPKPVNINETRLAISEKMKYEKIWSEYQHYSSGVTIQFADYIKDDLLGKCLEIGCGDGTTTMHLRTKGVNAYGMDITLQGLFNRVGDTFFNSKLKGLFFEGPAWFLPFNTDCFHCTYSTDVLEHIPPDMVDKSIIEILRVSKVKTIHCIATNEAREYCGEKVHLTVKPLTWWKDKFKEHNHKGIEIKIYGRQIYN